MMETNTRGLELTVPLRPNTSTVYAVALCVFIGSCALLLLFLLSPPPSPPIYSRLLLLFPAIASAPALVCIFYRCRARLILGETGLRWRTWGDWRRTPWDGVRDYFDNLPRSSGEGGTLMTLKTDAGDITLDRRWRESEEVRRIIQERARQAETAAWGVEGQRTSGTDAHTFIYRQNDFWFAVVFGVCVVLPYTAFCWQWLLSLPPKGRSFWGTLTQFWVPGDLWGSLFGGVFSLLLMVFMVFMVHIPLLIVIACVPGALDTRRRRAQRITTRRDGITFEDGRQHIAATWNEVTGYFLQPSGYSQSPLLRTTALSSSPMRPWRWVYVVETRRGSFQYSAFIDGSNQLGEIIKERAMPLQGRDAL